MLESNYLVVMLRTQKIMLLLTIQLLCGSIAVGQTPYVINGNAFSTSCDCYTLTTTGNWQVGSVWNANLLDLTNSFDMKFDVFLGCSNNGADGMVFGLQPIGTNIGAAGGGMGMGGVAPSLGVFIDTYQNGTDFDPVADHLSVQTNGDIVHDGSADDLTPAIILPNMEDCNNHILQVVWDAPTTQLNVFIDGINYATATADIVNTVFSGNPNVYWGFTAATGGLNNEQKFCIYSDLVIDLSVDTTCINQPIIIADSSEVSGGVQTWEWDFGDSSPLEYTQSTSHTYAAAGTYTLSLDITDVSGCTYTVTRDIEILEPIIASLVTNSACNACNGEIEIQATASVGPYQYSVDGGTTFQSDSIFPSICGSQIGQMYTLMVQDPFGCQNTTQALVLDDEPQIDNIVFVDSDCGTNNGEVSIGTTTSGGTAPYIYKIDGISGFQALPIGNLPANAPNTYNLIVEDNFGCTDTTLVTISTISIPLLDPLQIENVSCNGICDGTATISGANLMNYSIDNGATFSPTGVFNALCDGLYDVVVNNGFGCSVADQFTITKPEVATPILEADVQIGCEPLSVAFTNLSIGQLAKTEWSFSDGTNIAVVGAGDINHQFKKAGVYDVTIAVTTTEGCVFTTSYPAYIDAVSAPEANFTFAPKPPTIYNPEVSFTNRTTSDASSWFWNFGLAASPNASAEENPIVIYPEGIVASYPVKLSVANNAGCVDSITGTVNVISDVVIYAPNAFSPGVGQINQGWGVQISGIDEYDFHLTLFNRWGEIVWESYNPTALWDGAYGARDYAAGETFVWVVETSDLITAKTYEFRGTVSILK